MCLLGHEEYVVSSCWMGMCTALLDQLETGGFGRDYHLIQRKEEGNKRRREREREIERERREEEEKE